MERYIGGDGVTFSVRNEAGKVVRRDVVETNGRALIGYLSQQPGNVHLCIEEGEWSQWLHEILSPHVAELELNFPELTPISYPLSGIHMSITERRIAPRKRVRIRVHSRSGIQESSGQLVNISISGALLESASIHPTLGKRVQIWFDAPEVNATIELTGIVVRETKGGVAITFLTVTNELRQFLSS